MRNLQAGTVKTRLTYKALAPWSKTILNIVYEETRVFFFLAPVVKGPTALALKKWTLWHVLTKVFQVIFNGCLYRNHMFQLSHFEREAPVFRGQLQSSYLLLKSPVLKWSWLWISHIYKFYKLTTLFINSA